jgi:16S rRNA (cytidine1402-2'-O)-methyltransferase
MTPELPSLPHGLYIISSPLGNLKDITLRALDIIPKLDLLLCEDTRVTRKLLQLLALPTPKKLLAFHNHNASKVIPTALHTLQQQKSVGIISDAGTPLVSDPGFELTSAAINHHFPIIPVPGPSAPLAALVASGLPPLPFAFAGFPPHTKKKRHAFFLPWASFQGTVVFFESPHRIHQSLIDMHDIFGQNTPVVLAREITKTFEQFIHTSLSDILKPLSPLASFPKKGECCVLLSPLKASHNLTDSHILSMLAKSLGPNPSAETTKAVIQTLHVATDIPKKYIYQLALSLKS